VAILVVVTGNETCVKEHRVEALHGNRDAQKQQRCLPRVTDDDEIAYLPCAEKTRKLVNCLVYTAPKHELTRTSTVKTENGPISQEVSPRCLW